MTHSTPYAEVPRTPDAFIHQVQTQLSAVCIQRNIPHRTIIESAREEVLTLWDRPVKAYIPVLALRAAREQICPAASSVPPALAETMKAGGLPAEHGFDDRGEIQDRDE